LQARLAPATAAEQRDRCESQTEQAETCGLRHGCVRRLGEQEVVGATLRRKARLLEEAARVDERRLFGFECRVLDIVLDDVRQLIGRRGDILTRCAGLF
jgi:hypothetical protein